MNMGLGRTTATIESVTRDDGKRDRTKTAVLTQTRWTVALSVPSIRDRYAGYSDSRAYFYVVDPIAARDWIDLTGEPIEISATMLARRPSKQGTRLDGVEWLG